VGTWTSTNTQVATVNQTTGAITTLAAGFTDIRATVEGVVGQERLTVNPVQQFGTVTGLVTAADGTTPIPDALVDWEVTAGAAARLALMPPGVRTGQDGRYTLPNVPTGARVIVALRGTFRAQVNVIVVANQTVAAPTAALVSTGLLAYVPGVFDAIENIVQGQLGNPIDQISVQDLAVNSVTSKYRMIFLNCGLDETEAANPAVVSNLLAFMETGGTIYASDYAAVYVQALFPTFNWDYTGDAQNVNAQIVDASLQAFVGKTSADIDYNLDAWTDITALPQGAGVLLRGTYTSAGITRTNQPLAWVIPHGQGRLVFTTFHNEAGATADQIAVLRHFIYLP
jgi:hypothetical protein